MSLFLNNYFLTVVSTHLQTFQDVPFSHAASQTPASEETIRGACKDASARGDKKSVQRWKCGKGREKDMDEYEIMKEERD